MYSLFSVVFGASDLDALGLHDLAVKTAREIEASLGERMQQMQEKLEQELQRQREQLEELSETLGLTRGLVKAAESWF